MICSFEAVNVIGESAITDQHRIPKIIVFLALAAVGVSLVYGHIGTVIPVNDGIPGLIGALLLYVLAVGIAAAITYVLIQIAGIIRDQF